MHKSLTNWTARRSGTGLTVTGINPDTGKLDRITGIEQIACEPGGIFAIGFMGARHPLAAWATAPQ